MRQAQINTAGLTSAKLDWLDRSGWALVCTRCSLIQWFAAAPDRVYE